MFTTTPTTSRSTATRTRCSGALREHAPLYYNAEHDFYALSRYADVDAALVDWGTYSSARGGILELIRADIEMPPGVFIFEDPPIHAMHRGLLSRVFTPRKMNALEPKLREFCARSLDPLVGTGQFDFVGDLGAQMPMRTIGMLLGIPEADQEAVRDKVDQDLRTEAGQPMVITGGLVHRRVDLRGVHRLAGPEPLRRPDDRAAERRVHRRDRHHPTPDPRRAADHRERDRRRRQRDHHSADRLGRQGAGRPSRTSGASWWRTAR